MSRAGLLVCLSIGLGGCQTPPIAQTLPPPPPAHTVSLFQQEVEAGESEVSAAIRERIPIGMPVHDARALLEREGLSCSVYERWGAVFHSERYIPPEVTISSDDLYRLMKKENHPGVYCQTYLRELQGWRLAAHALLVVLVPDDDEKVKSVEVFWGDKKPHRRTEFFKEHPELQPPVGLPLAEAQSRMETAGFHRVPLDAASSNKDGESFVPFEAYDEGVLSGKIVLIRLYPDTNGIVRDVMVSDERGWFESERCMLPHGDESTAWAVGKGALFPVRVGCRYALGAAAVTVAVCVCCCFVGTGP